MKLRIPISLLKFGLVGTVGFAIDGGLLSLLAHLGVNIYLARAVSFPLAVVATWYLNRRLVFKAGAATAAKKRQEYGRYFAVQLGGAALNLLVFSILIGAFAELKTVPIVPFAAGSAVGLIFNYLGARLLVFKTAGVANKIRCVE